MTTRKIAVIVGSLRKDSFSRKLAKVLMSLAPTNLAMEEVAIGQLAMYNQDFDDEGIPPLEWTMFRETMQQYSGVLFITPEYNRSVPAVIKNALDVGSRPYGQSIWNGKPGAVVSISPGGLSAFGANHHLRQSLVFLNVPAMQQPEAYIGNAAKLFDSAGALVNAETEEFLRKFMLSFADWVNKNAG